MSVPPKCIRSFIPNDSEFLLLWKGDLQVTLHCYVSPRLPSKIHLNSQLILKSPVSLCKKNTETSHLYSRFHFFTAKEYKHSYYSFGVGIKSPDLICLDTQQTYLRATDLIVNLLCWCTQDYPNHGTSGLTDYWKDTQWYSCWWAVFPAWGPGVSCEATQQSYLRSQFASLGFEVNLLYCIARIKSIPSV